MYDKKWFTNFCNLQLTRYLRIQICLHYITTSFDAPVSINGRKIEDYTIIFIILILGMLRDINVKVQYKVAVLGYQRHRRF